MLLLIFILAFAIAGFAHAVLQAWAPSNILVRRVKGAPPSWPAAAVIMLLAASLILAMRVVELAAAAGGPTWFYLEAADRGIDAIKPAVLGLIVVGRRTLLSVRRWPRSAAKAQHDRAGAEDADAWQLRQDRGYEWCAPHMTCQPTPDRRARALMCRRMSMTTSNSPGKITPT